MDPLPFTLRVRGHDVIEGLGAFSISVKVEGMASWADDTGLTLEWAETQYIDEMSFTRVSSDVVSQPPLAIDIAVDELAGAAVLGGWWRPRVEFKGRYLDTFTHVPGSQSGRVVLWIQRRDRHLAGQLALALTQAIRSGPSFPTTDPRLELGS